METNQTDFIKSIEKMKSANRDGQPKGATNMVPQSLIFSAETASNSVKSQPGSEVGLESTVDLKVPISLTSSQNGNHSGTSDSQEIILDANFFMHGKNEMNQF